MKIGRACRKHPELLGKRHNGGGCVACTKEAKKQYVADNNAKVRAYQRRYNQENNEKVRGLNAKWRAANKSKIREMNLRRIGFTPQMVDEAIDMQNGKCAICEIELAALPPKQVHADHCHATGEARGVLCHHCNAGLGAFRDDPAALARAIEYLKRPTLGLI